MGRHAFFALMALTLVWIILMEEISWPTVAIGMFMAIASLHFGGKFLPFKEISNINFIKLATYPFFLIGQIYIAGFSMIKLVLTGFVVGVITFKTDIEDETLKIILADSITLVPGSILLEINHQDITILWITKKETSFEDTEAAGEIVKGKLERRLIKAQRQIMNRRKSDKRNLRILDEEQNTEQKKGDTAEF